MDREEESFDKNFASFYDELDELDEMPLLDMIESIKTRYCEFKYVDEGGIKVIQTCKDLKTGRTVAMARLKNDANDQQKEAFLKEARLTAALQHPNIIPMHDLGLKGRHPWFTMKFISGSSLEQILSDLKNNKKDYLVDLSDRLDVFIKVCDAIAYAHSRGVLHLDLKPDNIQISDYGDVLLCDWGLAKVMAAICDEELLDCYAFNPKETNVTIDGLIKGTPGYMAPEQTGLIKSKKGVYTDVFSLGCVLYKILTFKKPFSGAAIKLIMKKTLDCDFIKPTKIDTSIPLPLEAVCLKAMSKDPNERYASVVELQKEILSYRNGFATSAEKASLLTLMRLWVKRHRSISIASLLLVLISIFAAWFMINNLKLEKINAIQRAEKLSLEKEFHVKMGKDAAPRFYQRAQIAFNSFNFDDAVNFCDSAVELDPSLKEAWGLKGLLHIIYQEFNAAVKALEKNGEAPELLDLAKQFQKIKDDDVLALSLDQFLALFKQGMENEQPKVVGGLVHYTAYSEMPLAKRIEFCKGVIIVHNKKLAISQVKNQKIHFEYDRKNKHLDVSHNDWIQSALILQGFPAQSADLSHTKIKDFICFRNQPLKSLDVSYTKIIELNTLENYDLRNLNISHTAIANIYKLRDMSLKTLNISHSAVRTSMNLTGFEDLEKLYIHQGQFKLENLKKRLPNTEIIILP
ncbi:protein kinase [Lentisphaera profundi]|uniref:Protein kinase n=1 Tax=Lentisphaera profundi TaxID=1658616 RepID=A0ABY7VWP4_9BACT|nr:protein kinase [Lentisphaera profundi]WDE97615.1 protein kinase [Lentisphaera profundi]